MLPVFAKWVMQKRLHAIAAAFVAVLLPWCFWIGAAVIALCNLRKGFAAAVPVTIAGLVASGFWAVQGNYIPCCGVVITLVMALVLRARVSWSEMLIAGAFLTAVLIQTGLMVPPHAMEILTQLRQRSSEINSMLASYQQQGVNLDQLVHLAFSMMLGAIACLISVGAIALARYCQSALYNPDGFRNEFHALRLTPKELAIMVMVAVLGILMGAPATILVCWLPLLISGLALAHGVLSIKGMNGLWLVVLYVLLLTTWPAIVILLLLAIADTFANFRQRLASREH